MVVSSGDDGFTLSLIDGNEGQFLWIQGERTLFMKNTQIMFLTSNTNTDLTVLSGILMYNTEGMIIYFITGISNIPITKWDAKSMNMCMVVALNPT